MLAPIHSLAVRVRVLVTRWLVAVGFRDDSFLLILALLIGIITAGGAVAFHELIDLIRRLLYEHLGRRVDLYGKGIAALVLIPAIGGLLVAVLSRYVFRVREGHGIIDVLASVIRSSGVIRPLSALEKIITSAVTIGTGGSAGAEGPIVQIGAGIASGIGQAFLIARQHMPLLIGCGSAAGISAIFNSPIGGVFFTLEVILLDFSFRTFTPVVLASVIANVTTKGIFAWIDPSDPFDAIFAMSPALISGHADLSAAGLFHYALLGLVSGVVGVSFTRLMHAAETMFSRLPIRSLLKPAAGGALLGLAGLLYVVIVGWLILDRPKPVAFEDYPLPAFFSDGYGVIRQLITPEGGFYAIHPPGMLVLLLVVLCPLKVIGTCLTLASGGSGGIIAPSLFLGATAGALLGLLFQQFGASAQPAQFALVGMGAVLAAVVHAPLASILILLELTQDYKIILPAMLASVIATGSARVLFRDSIYTLALRARGVRMGTSADLSILRRLTVEQVELEPASIVRIDDSLTHLLDLASRTDAAAFVVNDARNHYAGMITETDWRTALLQREAAPLLTAADLLRPDIPIVSIGDDLASVLDAFAENETDRLPVARSRTSGIVIGIVSRSALLRRYQQALTEHA